MTITLYFNNSNPKAFTKNLTGGTVLTGTIRGDLNQMRPEIEINGNVTGYNYLYINDLRRYYFIDERNTVRTDLTVCSCTTDVLMTYGGKIKQCPAILARSANVNNWYITDPMRKTYQYTRFKNIALGSFSYPSDYIAILLT